MNEFENIFTKFFDPGRVGSIFLWLGSGRVWSAIYGLGLNLKISSKNVKFFNFLPFGSGRSRVSLLFTAGQK